MRAGVSNSDLVSALVLISLEHLTNLEQPDCAERQYLLPCLHPVIKAMIYLESPKDPFCSINAVTELSQRAHDYVSAFCRPKFLWHCQCSKVT